MLSKPDCYSFAPADKIWKARSLRKRTGEWDRERGGEPLTKRDLRSPIENGPRCLAADLEFASVDFATVEVKFELNRSDVGSK